MRLKEDSNNWRSHAIKKRDFKNDHSESAVRFRSKKDTNKWCRGKVGIKHVVLWRYEKGLLGQAYKMGSCEQCGKIMFTGI